MSFLQDAIDGAQGVKDVAAGAKRIPFDYSKIDPEFSNGEHIDTPDGSSTVNIDAKAGDNKGSASGEIEMIHFGRVYIDADAKFAHDEYDDNADIDLAAITGARAGMHRAALMRETLLQAGYLHAITWAMEEAGKTPPGNDKDGLQMVDQIMGMVGDLVGGSAAGALQSSTLDLNPLISQCNAIGKRLNQSRTSYYHLHKAGRDLHELRCKYRAFLEAQNKIEPTPAAPPAGLLGGLPLVGDALKQIPVVGDVLEWGDKIMGCSFQLVGRLTIEMHLKMETSVNDAVRDISIDAIRNRRAPVFKPWWKYLPPEATPTDDGDDDSGDDGLSIDLVKEVTDAIDPTLKDIDSGIKEYTSIFQREDKSTPGDAFIERAFLLNPQGSPLDRAEKMGSYGAEALCRVIAGDSGEDTSFTMPDIVKKIAGYIFQLVSEFIRAVYDKLLSLGEEWFTEAELAEAGRTHLLKSLTDWPLKEFNLDQYIDFVDQPIPSLAGGDPIQLSTRNLFENLRDKLIAQLGFMDAGIAFAMKSFYDLLGKARADIGDSKTRSMEVYLALVPTLHATMFRNLLLPFWGSLQNAVKEALGGALAPVMDELGAGGFVGDFYETVDTAQQIAARAQEAITLLDSGIGTHNIDKVMALGRDTNDPNTTQLFDRGDVSDVGKANPFGDRNIMVSAGEVDDAQREAVKPDLQWKDDAETGETPGDADGNGDDSSNGGAP